MSKRESWLDKDPKKIIIRMPNWLGDLVMATPLIKDLRKHFPKTHITAMCQSNVAPLIKEDPDIDEILSFTKKSGWIHGNHQSIVKALRFGGYDLGILTTNSFSSAWWFWRGSVKYRMGYAANFRSLLMNKAIPFPKDKEIQHQVITYKMLLTCLGISVSETPQNLVVTEEELELSKQTLLKYGAKVGENVIVGINPGAAYGSAKCWLPDRFAHVTTRLLKNPQLRIVYFGDQNTVPLVKDICENLPESVINLAGKTNIRELMAHIANCSAMLSNDSGPMHIAAALKTPLVAIFGSTNDVKTGPYDHGTVIHKHVACSPCYQRVCPIDFKCMTQIEVDEVCREILKLIDEVEVVQSNKLHVL
ncbi:MAG: lipopolysaccharide heptosyltransferase II [Chlamydiota bacterium]